MTHIRQSIRDYVYTRLNGQTAAQERIFNSRMIGIPPQLFPWIGIYTPSDIFKEPVGQAPRTDRRTVKLVIEAACRDPNHFQNQLDDLETQIMARIDSELGGLVESCDWQESEIILTA